MERADLAAAVLGVLDTIDTPEDLTRTMEGLGLDPGDTGSVALAVAARWMEGIRAEAEHEALVEEEGEDPIPAIVWDARRQQGEYAAAWIKGLLCGVRLGRFFPDG